MQSTMVLEFEVHEICTRDRNKQLVCAWSRSRDLQWGHAWVTLVFAISSMPRGVRSDLPNVGSVLHATMPGVPGSFGG